MVKGSTYTVVHLNSQRVEDRDGGENRKGREGEKGRRNREGERKGEVEG